MDEKDRILEEQLEEELRRAEELGLDDMVEDIDYTTETMKVRKTLRFRTFAAVIAASIFFLLRYFDPNLDFNNVNAPIFLVANLIVLFFGAMIYFYDYKIKTIQYKQYDIYRGYKLFNSVIEVLAMIPYLCVLITIVNMFFVSLSPITGTSMMPNFSDDDAVIFSHLSDEYERYDVVILHQDDENTPYLIKRIVGLPGETVTIEDNKVYINDVYLIEEYIDATVVKTYCTNPYGESCEFTVGENEYFVLGDNRDGNAVSDGGTSIDSRYFGPIDTTNIYGKVILQFKDFNLIK